MGEQDLKIEQYLNGELSAEEAATFEREVAQNEALAAELALQRDMQRFFEQRNPALEAELKNLGSTFFLEIPAKRKRTKRVFVALILLLVVALCSFLFFWQKENKTTAPIVAPQKVAPKPKELPFKDTIKDVLENKMPQQSPEPAENLKVEKVAPPIAEAESDAFLPNQFLEGLMTQNVRAKADELSLVFPATGQIFYSEGGRIDFKMEGSSALGELSLEALVFNNNPAHFKKNYPVFKNTFEPDATTNLFRFDAKISLQKGLYYLIIREEGTLEILHISNFLVK